MNDVDYQLSYIISSLPRIMAMQDTTPSSITYGCFHYAYWRDKTADFPDARFQEAGAALGLAYALIKNGSIQVKDHKQLNIDDLYKGFSAGLTFLTSIQRKDGSLDEWYIGERGFAAVEFPLIAYSLLALIMQSKDFIRDDRKRLLNFINISAHWLSGKLDCVKSNHQAAASAALALAFVVTGNKQFKDAAHNSFNDLASRQTAEGWFPEIGDVDVGYTSVLLDYISIYKSIFPKNVKSSVIESVSNFLLNNISQSYTINTYSGTCMNPYVSRLGVIIASQWSPSASKLCHLLKSKVGFLGIEAYLSDDLRLCRWAHLPLFTWHKEKTLRLFEKRLQKQKIKNTIYEKNNIELINYKKAGILNFKTKHSFLALTSRRPGSIFFESTLKNTKISLRGYVFNDGKKTYNDCAFNKKGSFTKNNESFSVEILLKPRNFFIPSQFMRVALRIMCVSNLGSKISRKLIDAIRLKAGSSLNQSTGSFSLKSKSQYKIYRTIKISENSEFVTITDEFNFNPNEGKIFIDINNTLHSPIFIRDRVVEHKFYLGS